MDSANLHWLTNEWPADVLAEALAGLHAALAPAGGAAASPPRRTAAANRASERRHGHTATTCATAAVNRFAYGTWRNSFGP
jgi:hypothetical protein